jgi:hypothetical protein
VGDDGVVLTDRERQALAGLAEQIGDPWLARQLVGQETSPPPQPPPQKRRFAGSIHGRLTAASASGWVGLLLLLAGAVLVVTTFVYSTVLGAFGLLVMGGGLWRLVADQGDVIAGRLRDRRVPAPAPPPPRTPPAAS